MIYLNDESIQKGMTNINESHWTKEQDLLACLDARRRRKKLHFCGNCGRSGHTPKQCQSPILSCGVIMFRRRLRENLEQHSERQSLLNFGDIDYFNLTEGLIPDSLSNVSSDTAVSRAKEKYCIEYLLVRRKDSLNYVEFIRGKYDLDDLKFLYQVFSEISIDERNRIREKSFSELWKRLWKNETVPQIPSASNSFSSPDYFMAEQRFHHLKSGYVTGTDQSISIEILLNGTSSKYSSPEWGFPKGKRNRRESDFDCARRELFEETRCSAEHYVILPQLNCVSETFKGSNNVFYKHLYFVACHKSDKSIDLHMTDPDQLAEIGDIGWFTADQVLRLFRPYDVERKTLLMRLDNVLSNFVFPEEFSNEYRTVFTPRSHRLFELTDTESKNS